jgi:uncharacterized protein (TIGR02246 family)
MEGAMASTESQMSTSTESEIRTLLESRGEAVWTKDLERLLSFYSPDIVYYDVVPGLQHVGSTALRSRFTEWFEGFESGIGQEIGDLHVQASGDTAVAFMLVRASGTLKTGQEVDYWVRVTSSFRLSNDSWLITHEHVSVPIDFQGQRPVMDLEP